MIQSALLADIPSYWLSFKHTLFILIPQNGFDLWTFIQKNMSNLK